MSTDDFFRARLDQMIDLRHPLAVLALQRWIGFNFSGVELRRQAECRVTWVSEGKRRATAENV